MVEVSVMLSFIFFIFIFISCFSFRSASSCSFVARFCPGFVGCPPPHRRAQQRLLASKGRGAGRGKEGQGGWRTAAAAERARQQRSAARQTKPIAVPLSLGRAGVVRTQGVTAWGRGGS